MKEDTNGQRMKRKKRWKENEEGTDKMKKNKIDRRMK